MRGKPIRINAEGYFAWALQHEIDHLNGILYLDRLDRPEDLRQVRSDDKNPVPQLLSVEGFVTKEKHSKALS